MRKIWFKLPKFTSILNFNVEANINSMDIDIEDDDQKVLSLQKYAFELWFDCVKSLAFILNRFDLE